MWKNKNNGFTLIELIVVIVIVVILISLLKKPVMALIGPLLGLN